MNTQNHVFYGAEGRYVAEVDFDRVTAERDALQQLLNARDEQLAQQHQGEPVALPAEKELVKAWGHDMGGNYEEGTAFGWNACLDEIAKLGPLYAHADPAEVHPAPECFCVEHGLHIEGLKAQLADAQALLRDALASHGASLMTSPPQDPWKTRRIAERIGAHLSASAEPSAPKCKFCGGDGYHHEPRSPGVDCEACKGTGLETSAPVEIDERAEFEAWFKDHSKDWPFPSESIKCVARDNDWLVWQARAALERKL